MQESLPRNEDPETRVLIIPVRSKIVHPGDSIVEVLSNALLRHKFRLKNRDILAVSSKIVGVSEHRVRDLDTIRPTRRASKLAREYSMDTRFVQIVLDEADTTLGGVKGALLTVKNGDAVANAGVDQKNAPLHSVVLWPLDPDKSARKIRASVKNLFRKDIGVVIVDSRVSPMRLGTTGFAIGSAGFYPVKDVRGEMDLSNRRVRITLHAVADGLAAAAQLMMGEAAERTPFAIIRDAHATFGSGGGIRSAKLRSDYCLYMSQIIKSKGAG